MIYEFRNALTGLNEYVETEELANARLAEIRVQYTQQEADTFSIAKVITNGSDETWTAADLAIDPEDGDYRLFVPTIGIYESFTSLSSTQTRKKEVVDAVMALTPDEKWKLVDAKAALPTIGYQYRQPITSIESF